jgi:GxxExxY protein
MKTFPLTDLTYKIIGICMEVHKHLGHGFLEVVYKDAIEIEAKKSCLGFCREKNLILVIKEFYCLINSLLISLLMIT